MEHEKPTIVCCLYAASGLGHFLRKPRSRVPRLGGKRRMEFNDAPLPSKRRMLIFNETDLANGSKKNGEQYEKTVLQESSLLQRDSVYYTQQRRKISVENDISRSRKGKGKMALEEKHVHLINEMGPQTPSPSKRKSKNDELNHSEKKVKGARGTTYNGISTQLKSGACIKESEENMLSYLSEKVEMAYYYTRSLKNLLISKLPRGQELINQPRTDAYEHSNQIGKLVNDRRVSLNGLEKEKGKFDLDVEGEVTKEWYKLLSAVPWDEVDDIWPEVLFIVKVGKVQGPRLYRQWKGSVVDSVVGALLTQRVSDNISSSAFMSLNMNFPQDPDCDLYTRHHRILRQKRSNACSNSAHKMGNISNIGKQSRMPFDEMKGRKSKKDKIPEEEGESVWEILREDGGSVRDADKLDSVDWDAVMRSNVDDVAEAIIARGMNHKLAIRIKDFLKRLVIDYGNLDLDWLRSFPPETAKDFLLSIYGIGLKSTECIRLLTLRQPAFPVDVNVARVTVRLGWVPAPSISDSILMGLLKENSKLHDRIHAYLSRRLAKFNEDTLYQLHCHMITFGKVFCTNQKPNCSECPMRSVCKYYTNLASSSSPCFQEKDIEDVGNSRTVKRAKGAMSMVQSKRMKCKVKEADTDTSMAPKTPIKVPLPRCRRTRVKKNTVVKARGFCGSTTRTEHFIYELPDLHPCLETFEDRDPDDPSPYLLVTWETDLTKPGETSASKSPSTSCVRGSQVVPGTIMIPCRTALKGNFPLNATFFQANEVFADWQTSQVPFDIPVRSLEGVPRKQLYCGSSLTTIVKGRSAEEISRLFHDGYICTRSFNRETYATKPLDGRLHKSTDTRKKSFK